MHYLQQSRTFWARESGLEKTYSVSVMNNERNNEQNNMVSSRKFKNWFFLVWNSVVYPFSTALITLDPIDIYVNRKKLDIKKGQKVLEVGSGTLPIYKTYANEVGKDGVFVALDINMLSQQIACKAGNLFDTLSSNQNTINFIQGDAEKLPFEDNYFDLIISSNLTKVDRHQLACEAIRVLKPGGKFISRNLELTILGPFDSEFIEKSCEDANFSQCKIEGGGIPIATLGLFRDYYVVARK